MLGHYSGLAFTVSGSSPVIAASASITVRREDTGAIASIYSDVDGLVPKSNPFSADSSGRFDFFAAGLDEGYRVTVTKDASSYTLNNQPVGNGMYMDISTYGRTFLNLENEATARSNLGIPELLSPTALEDGYLDWSVSGNALTVAVKHSSGNDPSASQPVGIYFRSATAATGSLVKRELTAATSVTVPSTGTMGAANSVAFRLWCVAFDDAGTVRLAVINCMSTVAGAGTGRDVTAIYPLTGWGIASATQVGTGSDSAQTFYSNGAAVSSKAYAVLGWASWESGLATAGTWSGAPTREHLWRPGDPLPGQILQAPRVDSGAHVTGTTSIPLDDTIPQQTEGVQVLTQAVTPTSGANALRARFNCGAFHNSGGGYYLAALFRDATANALAATVNVSQAAIEPVNVHPIEKMVLAESVSATTFKVRLGGSNAGTSGFNGSHISRYMGGVSNSFLEVQEVMA